MKRLFFDCIFDSRFRLAFTTVFLSLFLASCISSPVVVKYYEAEYFPDRIFFTDEGMGKTYLLTQRTQNSDRVEYNDLRYIVRGQILRVADQAESRYYLSQFCEKLKQDFRYPQFVLDRRPMLENLAEINQKGVVKENSHLETLIYSFSCQKKLAPVERFLKSAN